VTERTIATLQRLMFGVEPHDYYEELRAVRQEQRAIHTAGDDAMKAEAAALIAENAVDMQSYLPDWRLTSTKRHPDTALPDVDLADEVARQLRAAGGTRRGRYPRRSQD